MRIEIRDEIHDDIAAIRIVNTLAFGRSHEAGIVDALRQNRAARLSLVAHVAGQIVGHVMYSPITIDAACEGAALAPLAVLPEYQKQGIGSALVRAGNARLANEGCPYIIVLGHPDFYPRFGFARASQFGVRCEWNVRDEVFMLLVLDETSMAGVSGLARYRPEFATAVS